MDLNSMCIENLVDYINNELSKGRSLKDIETNDFNVNERVIAKRLSRKGYKRIDNKFLYESNTNVLEQKLAIKKSEILSQSPKNKNIDLDLSKLKELIDLIEPIKEVIHKYNESINIIEIEKNELKPKSVTEVRQKIFKVDIDVASRWDTFVANHKEFKVQQLISSALEEFITKYE